jgi:saccharopine dehydrogenase (NAD+, L-lysine-forming)
MYLDGQLKYVKFFEEDGIRLRRTFDFPALGDNIPVYPYPHPEQVTIPNYIKLKQVTNRGTVLPNEYYNLTKDICQVGLNSREPLRVKDQTVIPYDFAIAYILQQRERILKETDFGKQRGCCSVVVKGKKDGKKLEYRFHMASKSQALGEGTGIPAAMGAILIQQGRISSKGVFPPEGCVNPVDFIDLITRIMKLDKNTKGTESFSGVIVQKVSEDGKIETIDI